MLQKTLGRARLLQLVIGFSVLIGERILTFKETVIPLSWVWSSWEEVKIS